MMNIWVASIIGKPLSFSAAVRVCDRLYLSGQLCMDVDGKLPVEIGGQARQTMENIVGTLKTAGFSWAAVVECTVMLDDMANWPTFIKIYVCYLAVRPSRTKRQRRRRAGVGRGAGKRMYCVRGLALEQHPAHP